MTIGYCAPPSHLQLHTDLQEEAKGLYHASLLNVVYNGMDVGSKKSLLASRWKVQWMVLGIAFTVMLVQSLHSSMNCVGTSVLPKQDYWNSADTTKWQPQATSVIDDDDNNNNNRTLPPQSTACSKGDVICTPQGCKVSFDGKERTVAMCTIVKDEEPYIDEFVDYHHALG